MAVQLRAAGEQVDPLILIDTAFPPAGQWPAVARLAALPGFDRAGYPLLRMSRGWGDGGQRARGRRAGGPADPDRQGVPARRSVAGGRPAGGTPRLRSRRLPPPAAPAVARRGARPARSAALRGLAVPR